MNKKDAIKSLNLIGDLNNTAKNFIIFLITVEGERRDVYDRGIIYFLSGKRRRRS